MSNTIEVLGRRINQNANSLKLGATPTADEAVANPKTPEPAPVSGLNEFYQQFADNIAIRQQKQVQLRASGLDKTQLPHQIESTLKEIIIQLVRNSVVHGIESPEKRVQMGKAAVGNIQLSLLDLAESYKLTIEDDGAGINYEAIRQKAINMGFQPEDVATWSRQKLTSLLFKSGFSTQDTADEDAGRGVGLDIIKDNVQQLQGTLGVDTKENQYTRFTIKIPKKPNAE
ncbi:ATP-binding protein [Moraxella macacae]|uniref:ATP-binding protein n=1 Tax=Moraxella macacae TaxID=765840 RepID=UPI001D0D7F81|nr:ATP-binding protein [Moraxella macacae]